MKLKDSNKYGFLIWGMKEGLVGFLWSNVVLNNSEELKSKSDVFGEVEDTALRIIFPDVEKDYYIYEYHNQDTCTSYSIYRPLHDFEGRVASYCVSIILPKNKSVLYQKIPKLLKKLSDKYWDTYVKKEESFFIAASDEEDIEIFKSLLDQELGSFQEISNFRKTTSKGKEGYVSYQNEGELLTYFKHLSPFFRPNLKHLYVYDRQMEGLTFRGKKDPELPLPKIQEKETLKTTLILKSDINKGDILKNVVLDVFINGNRTEYATNEFGEVELGNLDLNSKLNIQLDNNQEYIIQEKEKYTIKDYQKNGTNKAEIEIILIEKKQTNSLESIEDEATKKITIEFEITINGKRKLNEVKGLAFQIKGYGVQKVDRSGKIQINDVLLNQNLIVSLKDSNYESYEKTFVVKNYTTKKVFQIILKSKEQEIALPSSFYISFVFPKETKEEKLDKVTIYKKGRKKPLLDSKKIKNYQYINLPPRLLSQDDTIKIDIESEKFRIIEDVEFVLGESHDGRGCIEIKLEAIPSNKFLLFSRVWAFISANSKKLRRVGIGLVSILGLFLLIQLLMYLFSGPSKPPQKDYTALQENIRGYLAEVNDSTWVLNQSRYDSIETYFKIKEDSIRDYLKTNKDSILSIYPSFDASSIENMYQSLMDSLKSGYITALEMANEEEQEKEKKAKEEQLRIVYEKGYTDLQEDIEELLKSDKFSARATEILKNKLVKTYSGESNFMTLKEQLKLYKQVCTLKYQIDKIIEEITSKNAEIAALKFESKEFKEWEGKIQTLRDNSISLRRKMGLEGKHENKQWKEIHRWVKELLDLVTDTNAHLWNK